MVIEMNKFVVIDKATSDSIKLETSHINLEKVSVVHTRLDREDVAEFLQEGNTLILKLKNGEVITIDNFFVENEDGVHSDLVFEDDNGAFWWLDWSNGVSAFKEISGIEVLLAASESTFGGMLPWILGGGAAIIGGIAAGSGGGSSGSNSNSQPTPTPISKAPSLNLGNGDQYITANEIVNKQVTIHVDVSQAKVGETLIIDDGQNKQVFGPLTAQDIQNGIDVKVDAPANGQDLTITGTIQDSTGKDVASTTQTYTVDTTAPNSPPVSIGNGDGYITANEIKNGQVEVKIDVSKAQVGDTLTVTDGKTTQTVGPLTTQQIQDGVKVNFTAPKEGESLNITATVTDPAGNSSAPSQQTLKVDTVAPTAKVELQNNGTVKFIFSEEVKDFTIDDVTVTKGAISNLHQESPNVWVADLNRDDKNIADATSSEVTVEVKQNSYTDLANNLGTSAKDTSYVQLSDDSYNIVKGLKGEYYGYSEGSKSLGHDGPNLTSLKMVEEFISTHSATAIFNATQINYVVNDGDLGGVNNLEKFLNHDKSSLIKFGGTDGFKNTSDAIMKFSGLLDLKAGTYSFRVTGDDGYKITLNGKEVVKKDTNQSAVTDKYTFTITPEQAGMQELEILYWDQGGQAKLVIELDNGNGYRILGSSGDQFYQDNPLVGIVDQKLEIDQKDLLSNDYGNDLKIQEIKNFKNGTATIVNDKVTFTPDKGFVGDASFDYVVSDGKGGFATATVHVKFDTSTGSSSASGTSLAMKSMASANDDLIYKVLNQDYEWDTSKENNLSTEFDFNSGETLLDIQSLIVDGSSNTSLDNYLTIKHEGSNTVLYLDRNGKDVQGYAGNDNVGEKLLTLINTPTNLTIDDFTNHVNYL